MRWHSNKREKYSIENSTRNLLSHAIAFEFFLAGRSILMWQNTDISPLVTSEKNVTLVFTLWREMSENCTCKNQFSSIFIIKSIPPNSVQTHKFNILMLAALCSIIFAFSNLHLHNKIRLYVASCSLYYSLLIINWYITAIDQSWTENAVVSIRALILLVYHIMPWLSPNMVCICI